MSFEQVLQREAENKTTNSTGPVMFSWSTGSCPCQRPAD